MRNTLAHALAKRRTAVAAMLMSIFAQEIRAEAKTQWKFAADALCEQPAMDADDSAVCQVVVVADDGLEQLGVLARAGGDAGDEGTSTRRNAIA